MPNSLALAMVETKTGALVRLYSGRLWPSLHQQHGVGLMLCVDMPKPGDGRHAEVYIDGHAVEDIYAALELWLKGPSEQ